MSRFEEMVVYYRLIEMINDLWPCNPDDISQWELLKDYMAKRDKLIASINWKEVKK